MRTSLLHCFFLALTIGGLGAVPAVAQQEIGRIDRMVEILDPTTEIPIQRTTDKVQVRRGGQADWTDAAPQARLRTAEAVRVARRVDARLVVDRANRRGTLVLLPELLGRQGGRVFPPAIVGQDLPEGRYALRGTPDAGDLVLAVEQGGLIVDWVHGRLAIEAAGTRAVIVGTRVAISVGPEGEQGLLYLETGAVEFPEHPELRVAPGQFVHLQRGLPPRLWESPVASVAEMRELIRYHNREVWPVSRTPFYRRPVVLISAAVVAGAVIYAATGGNDDDDGSRNGTVIVRIPF